MPALEGYSKEHIYPLGIYALDIGEHLSLDGTIYHGYIWYHIYHMLPYLYGGRHIKYIYMALSNARVIVIQWIGGYISLDGTNLP